MEETHFTSSNPPHVFLRCAVSAIIATRNDEELAALFKAMHEVDLSFFSNSTFGQFVRHMLMKGTLHDHTVLQKRLRIVLEDVTFLDAYNKSGACQPPRHPSSPVRRRLAVLPASLRHPARRCLSGSACHQTLRLSHRPPFLKFD